MDWDEYIEDGGELTELHLIVNGIRNRDLETYIGAHPEELFKYDTVGRSPFWHACSLEKSADIRTLLDYGASFTEYNCNFRYFFSILGTKAFDFMDEHLSSRALESLFKEGGAFEWFAEDLIVQLDVEEILAVDKLCLEHGFDVNHRDH